MRIEPESKTRSRVTLEQYPDLLKIRALPDYRFIDQNVVEVDTIDLASVGLDVAPVEDDRPDLAGHLFDYQEWIVDRAFDRERFALFADTGLGKAQPVDTPVLTPTGWTPIGDLAVGDEVISANGKPTRVNGVFPQGQRETALVEMNDGSSTVCDWDHLWNVSTDTDVSRGKPWRTMTAREILNGGLQSSGRLKWRIPMVEAVAGVDSEFLIHPYVLGVLIAEGWLNGETSISFTSGEEQIVERVRSLLPDSMELAMQVRGKGHTVDSYRIVRRLEARKGCHPNPFMEQLREYGLMGCKSADKFIPEEYLHASTAQRWDLLQGLMDCDGTISKDGSRTEYTTVSERLASDVTALVQSMGGVARIGSKIPNYPYKGEIRQGQRAYTMGIRLLDKWAPFTLERKAARVTSRKYNPQRKIKNITANGSAECVCIHVEDPSHLYVTEDYIVTHNTAMQLEWSRLVIERTGGKVALLAPKSVCVQTIDEWHRFYGPYEDHGIMIYHLDSRTDLDWWLADGPDRSIGVTNYEKFDGQTVTGTNDTAASGTKGVVNLKYGAGDIWPVDGVVLDESSMLKSFGSRKYAVIRAFDGIRYKLACSATPAPNQRTEFGQHALFLGLVRSTTEYLTAYFVNRDGDWEFKPHSFDAWVANLASWGVFVRDPARWGFADHLSDLPEMSEHFPDIDLTPEQIEAARVHERGDQASLFGATPGGVTSRTKMMQIAHGFELDSGKIAHRYPTNKPAYIADLANVKHGDEQVIIWVTFDEEGDRLQDLIPGSIHLSGKTKQSVRDESVRGFRLNEDGAPRVLILKPAMFGFGVNLQSCSIQIFSTITDSFERYYQCVRRSHRFGQTKPVTVYVPLTQLDQAIAQNTMNKQSTFIEDARRLEDSVVGKLRPRDTSEVRIVNTEPDTEIGRTEADDWTMAHADSIAHMPTMEPESVDLCVFSPPFAALYAYSKALGDMGNVRADAEFRLQWRWFAERLLPVMKPGRVVAIHSKEIIRFANVHGYRHCYDFPSDLRDGMVDAGFHYQRRVTIWKNPQLEATRNKETSLLHVTALRNASQSFPQTGEYVMLFTAPGDNEVPVTHERNEWSFEHHTEVMNTIWPEPPEPAPGEIDLWRDIARADSHTAVWNGIRETDVLTAATAKEHPSEKHVCPLQLGLIDRCVDLWTNPGETVFSPFAGIGSEGWSAIGLGRRFYGVELKESYYDTACKNLRRRVASGQSSLFDDTTKTA